MSSILHRGFRLLSRSVTRVKCWAQDSRISIANLVLASRGAGKATQSWVLNILTAMSEGGGTMGQPLPPFSPSLPPSPLTQGQCKGFHCYRGKPGCLYFTSASLPQSISLKACSERHKKNIINENRNCYAAWEYVVQDCWGKSKHFHLTI